MHYVIFVFIFVTWTGFALFFNKKIPKRYIFGNCKDPFKSKVKLIISLPVFFFLSCQPLPVFLIIFKNVMAPIIFC